MPVSQRRSQPIGVVLGDDVEWRHAGSPAAGVIVAGAAEWMRRQCAGARRAFPFNWLRDACRHSRDVTLSTWCLDDVRNTTATYTTLSYAAPEWRKNCCVGLYDDWNERVSTWMNQATKHSLCDRPTFVVHHHIWVLVGASKTCSRRRQVNLFY